MTTVEVEFIEETEVCERAIRRLAKNRNATVTRTNGVWVYEGVEMDSDEVWSVLSAMPVHH